MKWRNLFSPAKVGHALRIEAFTVRTLAGNGYPDTMLQFLGGLGDELLLTCVARELKKRGPDLRIWQVSTAAELLRGNPDYHRVFPWSSWPLRHSNLMNRARLKLRYSEEVESGERELPVREHILAVLCRVAGIAGHVHLRPYCHLTDEERLQGRVAQRQLVLHSVGVGSFANVMKNKLWYHERFQRLVDELRAAHPDLTVVQIGVERDPPLSGVLDVRGKTTLRQAAGLLSQSECFVGTSGLFAHLARAVDCRAVIVYGGREHSWQSGYVCNESLDSHVPCAPCWRWNGCEHDRICMKQIEVADVLGAVERVLGRGGTALETQEVSL
jgi:ADP-heptose:LPS heptosyltransferase